jgi:Mn-dependent DtxR family transcriptional regulator
MPEPFTTADLAEAMDGSRRLAQRMAYCLRKMGCITQVGRRGRAKLYERGMEDF